MTAKHYRQNSLSQRVSWSDGLKLGQKIVTLGLNLKRKMKKDIVLVLFFSCANNLVDPTAFNDLPSPDPIPKAKK